MKGIGDVAKMFCCLYSVVVVKWHYKKTQSSSALLSLVRTLEPSPRYSMLPFTTDLDLPRCRLSRGSHRHGSGLLGDRCSRAWCDDKSFSR